MIDLKELREAAELMSRIAAACEKIAPVVDALKGCDGKAILPAPADRLIHRGEVEEMLGIGTGTLNKLIAAGKLTVLYVGDSTRQKFRLSQVEQLTATTCPKEKNFNLRRKTAC